MSETPLAEFVTKEELAQLLRRRPRTIERWTGKPDGLPHVRLGKEPLYHLPAVRDWILSKIQRPVGARKLAPPRRKLPDTPPEATGEILLGHMKG